MAPIPPRRHSAPKTRWRMPWAVVVIGLIMVAGAMLILYPPTASWFAQYNQSRIVENTNASTQHGGPSWLEQELLRAYSYNQDLAVGESLVSPDNNLPTSSGSQTGEYSYDDLLNATPDGVMGRLRIGAIKVDLPIYHGTSDEVLTKGVGHLEGTSLPVGGVSEHSVLTAHRGLPSAELFNNLHELDVGDMFTVEVFGEILTYRVGTTQTILPTETQSLIPVEGKDLMTLVTCTPLGVNTHRYLVTGERVTPTPPEEVRAAGATPDIPGFPWWALGVCAVGIGYGAAIIRGGSLP